MNSTFERHPKNKLQMLFAYSGASLSVTLSVALSVLLFWSISENIFYGVLFAGIALVLELCKFMALPEIAYRKQRKDWMGTLSATLLFLVLASASILGSIGGLQSDTHRVEAGIAQQQQKRVAMEEERRLLLDEVAENQQAIDKYIALSMIKNFAQPLQEKNRLLRQQAADVQAQINELSITHETAMTALLGAIATALGKDKAVVQVYVFVLLAALLDLVAGFFISLIREENQFKASLANADQKSESVTHPEPNNTGTKKSVTLPEEGCRAVDSDLPTGSNVVSIKRASAVEKYAVVKQSVSRLKAGDGVYKRQTMKDFQIGQKTVDKHYRWLLRDGLIVQDDETKLFSRAA